MTVEDSEAVFFRVEYAYEMDGKPVTFDTHKNNYFGPDQYADAKTLADRYPVGETTVCYVSPREPHDAVHQRRSPWALLWAMIPVGLVVTSCLLFYLTWWVVPFSRSGKPGQDLESTAGT